MNVYVWHPREPFDPNKIRVKRFESWCPGCHPYAIAVKIESDYDQAVEVLKEELKDVFELL